MPGAGPGTLPALPEPAAAVSGKRDPGAPQLTGKSRTTISDFSIEDPEGNKVLIAKEIGAALDLVALASHLIRMPSGHARSVTVLLRRGKSGRVSLAEALGKREPGENSGNALAIGPLEIDDARITVAVTERPVVFQIDRAVVQVQKKRGESAPKVFLSGIHGHMADPDPLPQPLRIRGGRGVIDLAGDPLVDLRARVCIGGSEMRVQINIPQRHGPVNLRVDADGFSARTARIALNMVSKSKERLQVSSGPVEVTDKYDCTRAEGRDSRARVERTGDAATKRSR
jgi:hypothetical protein